MLGSERPPDGRRGWPLAVSLGHALLLAGLVTCSAACREERSREPAAPPEASRLVSRAMTSRGAEDDLFFLCDRFGGRLSGSESADAAGRWLARRLSEAGLERVGLESFALSNPWIPVRESAECTEPVRFRLRVAAVPGSRAFPASRAPLRAVALESRDTDPGAAVALISTPESSHAGEIDPIPLRESVTRAAQAGFRALLIQSPLARQGLFRKVLGSYGPLPLPVAVVGREEFGRLTRLSARSPVMVKLDLEVTEAEFAGSFNVVGDIRGSDLPEEVLLLGAHYDSWDLATGAQDNAVNVALLLDVARGFRELGLTPRRTLRLVLFAGEEQDRQGSAAYVRRHEAELDEHVFALFFDLGGAPINGFFFNERREVAAVFEDALRPFPEFRRWMPLNPVYSGTDNLDFLLEGVPTSVASTNLEGFASAYHSALDLPETVDPQTLRRNVALVSAVVWHLANRPARPSRRQSPAETLKLVGRFGIRPQIEGSWRWDRLLRQQGEGARVVPTKRAGESSEGRASPPG